MDTSIALILLVDGLSSGAVYALLAMSLVLVYSVTRIVFIPQGEYVAFSALTLSVFQTGKTPGLIWLLVALTSIAIAIDVTRIVRHARSRREIAVDSLKSALFPVVCCLAGFAVVGSDVPFAIHALVTLMLTTALGPLLYRLAYRSIANASVLILLIVSVALHFVLSGIGLLIFGPEGSRLGNYWDRTFRWGSVELTGQHLVLLGVTVLLISAAFLAFGYSLWGKALRASAVNLMGSRLMGIRPARTGSLCFALAAFVGGVSGLLLGPTTTIFYDTGFLVGLKGFVAAVFAGLISFPGALLGALIVGLVESFGSFWFSAFKEVIVFGTILPLLLWRSQVDRHHDEEH